MPTEEEEARLAKIVAANVKRLRSERRLSQKRLSILVGASASYIHNLEQYDKLPSFIMGLRISKTLGVRPEMLLERR